MLNISAAFFLMPENPSDEAASGHHSTGRRADSARTLCGLSLRAGTWNSAKLLRAPFRVEGFRGLRV